jgi:hypothetical protein
MPMPLRIARDEHAEQPVRMHELERRAAETRPPPQGYRLFGPRTPEEGHDDVHVGCHRRQPATMRDASLLLGHDADHMDELRKQDLWQLE